MELSLYLALPLTILNLLISKDPGRSRKGAMVLSMGIRAARITVDEPEHPINARTPYRISIIALLNTR